MEEVAEVRPVPGYEGHYEVDSLGNVFSLLFRKRHKLKPATVKGNYQVVVLTKDKKPRSIYVHQLIAMAFLDHTRCGHEIEVDHEDRNPRNNRLDNLRLVKQPLNALQRGVQKRNKSGVTGVLWHNRDNIWEAYIRIDWKLVYLGRFRDVKKAAEARRKAEGKRIEELEALLPPKRKNEKSVDLSTY